MPEKNITVFISYATEDYDTAKKLYDDLKQHGIVPWLDRENLLAGQNWRNEIPRVIRECDYFLLLISQHSVSRRGYIQKEQKIALDILDESSLDDIFIIPARLDQTELRHEKLKNLHWADLSDYDAEFEKLLKIFQPHSHAPATNAPQRRSSPQNQTVITDIDLPPTDADLFGRDRELEMLDSLWSNPQKNIAVLVARGGEGKTALVNKWLSRMALENFKGAHRVFGWSFYSQGAGEDKQASADRFIDAALRWFRDPHPNEGDAVAKGKRLGGYIQQQKTLLILDGLEPLQHPPGAQEGLLKDTGLKALLRSLAVQNPGLCLITTRLWTDDLKSFLGTTVEKIDLSSLAPEEGAALLKYLGVDGTEKERKKASEEFDGHALALTLLGTYLSTVCGGDVRKKDTIECLMTEEDRHGCHARRMMESYEKWMQDSEKGRRELNILRILGLFDRPAESGAIKALLEKPEIEGLTDELQDISEVQWQFALKNLRELRLIYDLTPGPSPKGEGSKFPLPREGGQGVRLDCHPLIREHFAEKLRKTSQDAWKQAHSRLYEYYKNLPEKEYPDTLEEMEPLFAAVAHGCMAGRYQETHDNILVMRIERINEYFIVNKLGAFGSYLSALSAFFEKTWSKPTTELYETNKYLLLNKSSICLQALGRLREALQVMQTSSEATINQGNLKDFAKEYINISDLLLFIGDISQSVLYARKSVFYANICEDGFTREVSLAKLADALHHTNEISQSLHIFKEAEIMQKERLPKYSYLFSVRGFKYCDLLINQGNFREVINRAEQLFKIGNRDNVLLEMALGNLYIGKTYLLQAQEQGSKDFTQAEAYLHQAVDGLVKARQQQYFPLGYLARAALFRIKKEFANAHADLDEVFEIADRGEMKLHLTDYHLESCRLCLAENKPEDAKKHLAAAKELIEKTGYHRRDKEAAELAGMLSEP